MGYNKLGVTYVEIIDWFHRKYNFSHVIGSQKFFDIVPNIYKKEEFTIAGLDSLFRYNIIGRGLIYKEGYFINAVNVDNYNKES